jgi:hypothetical protein
MAERSLKKAKKGLSIIGAVALPVMKVPFLCMGEHIQGGGCGSYFAI